MLLIALVIYVNYFESHDILPEGEEAPINFLQIEPEDIREVRWQIYDEQISVQVIDDKAVIVKPEKQKAQQETIWRIFAQLAAMRSIMTVEEQLTDYEQFGIDKKGISLVIKTDDVTHTIYPGRQSPVGTGIYLKKEDDLRVFMVPTHLRGIFTISFDRLKAEEKEVQVEADTEQEQEQVEAIKALNTEQEMIFEQGANNQKEFDKFFDLIGENVQSTEQNND